MTSPRRGSQSRRSVGPQKDHRLSGPRAIVTAAASYQAITDTFERLKAAMSTFTIGQMVHHRKFDYRGVVVGVDQAFQGSAEWYDEVARSRPPKDKPWYHVLVHGASHRTYVAERHLEPDVSGEPIEHPERDDFFDQFRGGVYSNSLWN